MYLISGLSDIMLHTFKLARPYSSVTAQSHCSHLAGRSRDRDKKPGLKYNIISIEKDICPDEMVKNAEIEGSYDILK